ncbi:hypothetical protein B6N60_01936 [Richelia sinica FACHB-800]|uniref:SH3b domain-containing protein n=2 Tax=Richelia TaxID=98443 RepID=A0A975Y4K0_9NOST|nr:SH3 domain-containing protein [Richelia sinica]MBD2664659.1 SH3 domain-containing protein [Richelia sinica FACHB-800]QXE23247.1 hypothetical protein B6N60_01936 [Richelia sinica FACHB-800]
MLSGCLKFIIGVFLAMVVLLAGGVTVALYFMNRTAIPPAKPMFANDYPAQPKKPKGAVAKNPPSPKPEATAASSPSPSPSPITEPSPSPSPSPSPDALPPGAYRGQVTWPQGLSLRSEPKSDAERVGGVGGNQKIIVLEASADQAWLKIQVEGGTQTGWVKAGNIQKLDEQPEPAGVTGDR